MPVSTDPQIYRMIGESINMQIITWGIGIDGNMVSLFGSLLTSKEKLPAPEQTTP